LTAASCTGEESGDGVEAGKATVPADITLSMEYSLSTILVIKFR